MTFHLEQVSFQYEYTRSLAERREITGNGA